MKLSFIRTNRRRAAVMVGAGSIIAAAIGVLPANAAVNFADAAFSGSASGEAIHVGVGSEALQVDVAHASTAVNSKGIAAAATDPAIDQPINPALPSKDAYSYGKGLDAAGISLADEATSSAPPNGPLVLHDVQVPVSPLVYASLTRGAALSKWNADTCVIGSDIANGVGYVADAQLVGDGTQTDPNLGLTNPLVSADTGPSRDVTQTIARETLVPNSKGAFGLKSTVATQLVPLTIAGTLKIEVAGDWVLSAIASGVPGESKVEYKPAGTGLSPTLPVLQIFNGPTSVLSLTLQQLLGSSGLTIPIPGLANVTIGTPPTQTISADGTTVSASADVASITLVDGTLANIRVGHAAVTAKVPAGGVTCPIPVSKKSTPAIVNSTTAPDGKFQVAITIRNGFDCDLINITAVDEIIRKSGNVTFEIATTDPRNDPKSGAGLTVKKNSTTSSTATYTGLGNLAPGATKVLNLVLSVPTTGSGEIQDTATAKGTLNCGDGSAIGKATIDLSGNFTLVTTVSKVLARTGGEQGLALLLGGSAIAAVVTRRFARSRRAQA